MKPSRRAVSFGFAGFVTTAFMPTKLNAALSSIVPAPITASATAELATAEIQTDFIWLDKSVLESIHPSRLLPVLVRNSVDGSDLLLDETLIYDIQFNSRGAVIAEWQSSGMLRMHEVADLGPEIFQKAVNLSRAMPEGSVVVDATPNASGVLRSVGSRQVLGAVGTSEETVASTSMEASTLPRQLLLRAQQAMRGYTARIGRARTAFLPPRPERVRALPAPVAGDDLAQS